jgi:hypothetical protein
VRKSSSAWPVIAALLVAGAIAGALLAYFLTRDNGSSPAPPTTVVTHVQTVTSQGQVTTVERTATVTTAPLTTTSAPPTTAAPPSSQSGAALNNAGYAKMQAGDYAGALPLLEQAVQRLDGTGSLDEAYAKFNLAYTRYHLGNCDGVLDLLDQAQAIEGRKAPIDSLRRQAQQNC